MGDLTGFTQPDQPMIMVNASEGDDNLNKFNKYVESNKQKLTDQNFFITVVPGIDGFKIQASLGAQNLKTFDQFDDTVMDKIFKLVDLAKDEMAKPKQAGGREIPTYKNYKYKYMKYKMRYLRHKNL